MTTDQSSSDQPPAAQPWRWRRIGRRIGLAMWGLFALFLLCGLCYEQLALRSTARDLPPRGVRADIGGRKLHVQIQGRGAPTVVFESGLGATSMTWDLVAPQVAKVTRVVTYDRAGLGWSDPGPPADAAQVAEDLYAALTAAEIDGPYVLVGHSIGGIYARMFSYQHPQDVAGIVLVDSSHEDQFDRFPEVVTGQMKRMRLWVALATFASHFGIPRMATHLLSDRAYLSDALPPDTRVAIKRMFPNHASLSAIGGEMDALSRNGLQLKEAALPWHDLPLVVLTAGDSLSAAPPDVSVTLQRLWNEFQQELASRSTNSIHRTVIGSGHNIHHDRPEIVIGEIIRLVESIRTSG